MQCLWLMSWYTSVDVYSHSATAEQSLACRTLGCSSCWLTGFRLSEMHLSFLIPFLLNCLKQCSHCTWLPGWFSLCCCEIPLSLPCYTLLSTQVWMCLLCTICPHVCPASSNLCVWCLSISSLALPVGMVEGAIQTGASLGCGG